tara:strand:+ start:86845 stop:87504 length:660 start_codon:yes stop_codon:yes gene_type:complete
MTSDNDLENPCPDPLNMTPDMRSAAEPANSKLPVNSRPIIRRANGQLEKGSAPLPGCGRPKGSGKGIPPMSVLINRVAEEQGVSVAEAMGAVAKAAFRAALAGDTTAMKMLLSRAPDAAPEDAPGAAIAVGNAGPPIPDDVALYRDFGRQMLEDLKADIDAKHGPGTAEAMKLDPVKDREAILAHARRPDRQAQGRQMLAELKALQEADEAEEIARLLS